MDMIVLYKKGHCEVFDSCKLESFRDDTRVYRILFPVGIYAPEYVVLDPEEFPRRFKKLIFEYDLYLETWSDDGWSRQDVDHQKVVCDRLDELVLFVHSIYKLRGFELIQGQNEFGDLSAFSLTNMTIYRKGNKKEQFLDVNEETMPSFGSEILDIIDVINLAVNKNPKKDVVPRVNARDTIFINYKSRKWHMDKHLKYDVKSCALLNYNAITFVSDEDYELMKKIKKSIFIQMTILVYENANLPYTHLTSRRIYEELEGEYLEIFTDIESYLYDTDAIIELITNISHIAMCTRIQTEVNCGIMEGMDNIFEVKFTIDGFYDEDGCLEEFMYPLRNSQLDKRDNFTDFANFVHLLIINHERKRKKC